MGRAITDETYVITVIIIITATQNRKRIQNTSYYILEKEKT